MNSKRLIIAFFAVSLAAVAASCGAVISVARTYSNILSDSEAPAVSVIYVYPETVEETETAPIPATDEITEIAKSDTEPPTEESSAEETTAEETTIAADFILFIDGDRLVILSPAGERVYERITDVSRVHPKDLEALLSGIAFGSLDDAMSAVYDVIS